MHIRKRFFGPHLVGLTAIAASLVGCGGASGPAVKPQVSEITAINSAFDPRIGEAYNQYADQYMAQSCLGFDPNNLEYIPPQFGELIVTRNSSFDQLQDTLGGGGELNLNLSAFQASGSLQFANEMQASTYSTNYMISLNMKGGELALPQQYTGTQAKPALNALGVLAKGAPNENDRVSKCGTRFVSRKSLSANVVAVLKFEFSNKGQKDSFAGKIALNLGEISGKAQLEAALNKASESANITLKVVQMGGDASQLSKALSTDISMCNSQDRASCLKAIDALTVYVRDEFPKQFVSSSTGKVDPNRFVATNYEYGTYESVDDKWIPPALSPEKAKQLGLERRLIGEKMLDEEANYFRASSLVRSGLKMSPQQLEEVRGIQTIIIDRLKVYADAAQVCYQSANWTLCATALDAVNGKLKADPTRYAFDITKLIIVPSDIGGWCAKMKQWGAVMLNAEAGDAVASTILSDDELFTLYHVSKKIFADATDTTKSKEIQFDVTKAAGPNQTSLANLSCWDVKQNVRDIKMGTVDLTAARLANVDPLASLYYTSNLILTANFVEDATALSKIRYLTTLNLSQNRVTTLAGINSTNIETLNLSNNGLKKGDRNSADSIFRELSGSQTLRTLILDSNPALRVLSGLTSMPALTTISLLETAVDQDELLALQKRRSIDFKSLQSITVRGSLVSTPAKSCIALATEIPGLTCR